MNGEWYENGLNTDAYDLFCLPPQQHEQHAFTIIFVVSCQHSGVEGRGVCWRSVGVGSGVVQRPQYGRVNKFGVVLAQCWRRQWRSAPQKSGGNQTPLA